MIRGIKTVWFKRFFIQQYGRRYVAETARNLVPLAPTPDSTNTVGTPSELPITEVGGSDEARQPVRELKTHDFRYVAETARNLVPLAPPPDSRNTVGTPSELPITEVGGSDEAEQEQPVPVPVRELKTQDFLDSLDEELAIASTCTEETQLEEEYKDIRNKVVYRGLMSPFLREDMEMRHLVQDCRTVNSGAGEPFVLNAYYLITSIKKLCKDISADDLLDYLCRQHAIVTPQWNKKPAVSICIDFYEKGPSFSPPHIKFLRGECDGSYKKDIGLGSIAIIIWDGLNILWCERCLDVAAKSSVDAEAKAMLLLLKRARELTEYLQVCCDLEHMNNVMRGYAVLDPDGKDIDILSTVLLMKNDFKILAARRVPREGLTFVDQLMRIEHASRFSVPLPEWKPIMNGYPIFSLRSSKSKVREPGLPLKMPEYLCYAEAEKDQRLYALKHIVGALQPVSSLLVVVKDINSIAPSIIQLFSDATTVKSEENVLNIQFGRCKISKELCVVLDVGLQQDIRVEEFGLVILIPQAHETPFLRSIPEFSVRSKNSFKGPTYTPPRLGAAVDIKNGLAKTLLKAGKGLECPNDGDEVEVQYSISHKGKILHSSSSLDGPYITKIGQDHILGWNFAIKSMTRGEKAHFKIPFMLAYGEAGFPPTIPPKATLDLEVELVSWTAIYHICENDGIVLKMVKQGYNWQTPKDCDKVTVSYEASLEDGTTVSKSSGAEFVLNDGMYCAAIAKSVKTMRRGEKVFLVVQPEYGFGKAGRLSVGEEAAVPPDAMLYINLELHSWKSPDETSDNNTSNMSKGFE